MSKTLHHYAPTATALAVTLMLAACGGGDAEAPPAPKDTTPPTVTISDNVSDATATGAVTFTFNFSESVGSSFTADDVVVTGGTKGTFTSVSTTQATLVVTPTANATGTLEVSVAAGKFADAANNANTAAASAAQAYNTVPPVVAYITFDESPDAIKDLGVYGANTTAAVEAGPAGGTAKALKITKPAGPDTWGGAYFTVPKVPFTATKKGMTAKVYSSVANSVVHLKVEVPGGASVEVAGTPTGAANTWSTVTWNFSAADVAANYTILAVTPDRTRVTDGAVYYIDNFDVVDTPAAPPATSFASAFGGANNTTAEGGAFNGYSGSNLNNWNCPDATTCGSGLNEAKDRLYYYYNAAPGTTGLYAGVSFTAPGIGSLPLPASDVSGFNVAGKTKFKFTFGQNPEWFTSNDKNFGVLLTLSKIYSVGTGTNNCRIELLQVVTPTSADDTAYSINLSDFRVLQDCGSGLSASAALTQQTVAQLDFKANAGSAKFAAGPDGRQEGANLNVLANGFYSTTLVIKGPLQFE